MKNFRVVLIKRIVPPGKDIEVLTLVSRLRARAAHHSGFITTEVLWDAERPERYLTLTQWASPEDWNRWAASPGRLKLQKQLDAIEGCTTEVEMYRYPIYWDNIPEDTFPGE